MRGSAIVVVLALAGCGRFHFTDVRIDAGVVADGVDGAMIDADLGMPFVLPLGGIGSRIKAVVALPHGGAVVGGSFTAPVMFGDVALTPDGTSDAFVASITPDGRVRWVQTFGGPSDDKVVAIAVDGNGAVYAGGQAAGPLNFGDQTLPTQQADGIIVSYQADGTPRWAHIFGGNADAGDLDRDDDVTGLVVASNGDLVVTGTVNGIVDFGDGQLTMPTAAYDEIFIARFASADATVQFAHRLGDTRYNEGFGVAMGPDDSIYLTGYYEGTPDLGTGAVPYRGTQDSAVIKLDGAGNVKWVYTYGGAGFDWPYAVAILDQTVVVGGFYEDTIDLPGGLPAANGANAVLSGYSFDGAFAWSFGFGGAGCNRIHGLTTTPDGEIAVAGSFIGSIMLDRPLVSTSGIDAMLATITADGTFTWSYTDGGALDDFADAVSGSRSTALYSVEADDTMATTDCLHNDNGDGQLRRM